MACILDSTEFYIHNFIKVTETDQEETDHKATETAYLRQTKVDQAFKKNDYNNANLSLSLVTMNLGLSSQIFTLEGGA